MAKHVDDTRAFDQPTMVMPTGERSNAIIAEYWDKFNAGYDEYMATRHG